MAKGDDPWLELGGRLLARMDVFLSQPLRQSPQEALRRHRLIALVALGQLVLGVALLPWTTLPLALGGLGLHALALGLLSRQRPAVPAGLLVCLTLALTIVLHAALRGFSPAPPAGALLLPAVAMYVLGVRRGFWLTLGTGVVVSVLLPLRALLPGGPPWSALAPQWPLDVSVSVFMLGTWAVIWMYASARVQERVFFEQRVRAQREIQHKLTTLIENTDDPACSLDLQGRLIIGNTAMQRYHQRRHGHEVRPGQELFAHSAEQQHKLVRLIHQAVGGRGMKIENPSVADGDPSVMEMSFKSFLGEDGQPMGVTLFGRDVTAHREAETKLTEMHRSLIDVSRQAGMAEVVTGLLHNVGNTLNSINVSVHLVTERIRTSRVGGMVRAAEMLHLHRESLGPFLEQDPRGQQLPSYMLALARQLVEEQQGLLAEQRTLTDALDHVKSIISMQQEHARVSAPVELVKVGQLIDDALRLHTVSFQRSGIEIRREYDEQIPPILLDRHKLLQILLNLLSNARHALLDGEGGRKCITIRLAALPDDRLRIQVADNGQGISAEHLTRMFTQGFTTKKEGHGFGLHISALAAIEMAGTLSCESDGPGQGATFTIDLPMQGESVG